MGRGEGLGFYATVQSGQVGGGGRGNDKRDFRVTAVANDPALSHVDAVVGANFPGKGIGDGSGLQDGGALVRITRDGDISDPVGGGEQDRKSTRLNSSHSSISYAVFCLKKKNPSYRICLTAVT